MLSHIDEYNQALLWHKLICKEIRGKLVEVQRTIKQLQNTIVYSPRLKDIDTLFQKTRELAEEAERVKFTAGSKCHEQEDI